MRKNSVTGRALKLYHSYNPKYFPTKFAEILFNCLAPFFTLWMSSEIITALYEGRNKNSLVLLVTVTLVGNLLIRILEAVLKRNAEVQLTLLQSTEAAAFNAKTISLDYDKLEDPAIRQHRRTIEQNSWINGYGMLYLRLLVETLMECCFNILLSIVLFLEMLSLLINTGFTPIVVALLVGLVVTIALNFAAQSRGSRITAESYKRTGAVMLEENRMAQGQNGFSMDERIYRQRDIIDRINKRMQKLHLKTFTEQSRTEFLSMLPSDILTKVSELCSYLIICLYCSLGAFPVGSVIKYVGYLNKLTSELGGLLSNSKQLKTNEQFLEVYLDYFDIQNDMYQGSLSVEKRSDKKFDIEFKNVSFKYQGTDNYALKNINLDLKVGERLAVVGMNGSGKTTFIKLLCRLYDPTEGEIFMNDFNIRKYDYRQYLDLFSVVFQDYNLLSVPLGNNVASSDTWDTEKAERLLEEVGFGERYATMSRKLETPLYKDFDEDGVNVSGGEAQKIALARALYKDAPFIILDEPTAALDPIAEAEIYSKFDQIVGDKTAIYISHRLSSCRFCDKIAVFDKGEIVQIGTHDELLSNESGKYYELWNAQAQYYTEKTA